MLIRGVAAGALALAVLGGCATEEPTAAPTSSTPSPTPSTPSVRPPLTVAQYRTMLGGIERRIRPLLVQAMATRTLPATDTARVRLAMALEREYQAAEQVTAPRGLQSEHSSLLAVLGGFRQLRSTFSTTMLEKKNSCGLPKPLGLLLYDAKVDIYYTVGGSTLKVLTEELAKKKITFGKAMMPAGPERPRSPDRRGTNGKVLQRSGPRGSGVLRITNDDDFDVVVAVVPVGGNPKRPQASIYVRAGSRATLTGTRGTYAVYFKSGTDWDARHGSFTENCSYERFVHLFDQRSSWRISLAKTATGNAPTDGVSAF